MRKFLAVIMVMVIVAIFLTLLYGVIKNAGNPEPKTTPTSEVQKTITTEEIVLESSSAIQKTAKTKPKVAKRTCTPMQKNEDLVINIDRQSHKRIIININ